jgi:hypothetical protein
MRRLIGIFRDVLATAVVVTVAGQAFASPGSRAWIPELTANADVVVVGFVRAAVVSGTVSATIDVERVLKGLVAERALISVLWVPPWPYPDGPAFPRDHGMFFLQRSAAGPWVLMPAAFGSVLWWDTYVRTPDVAVASPPPGTKALDRVLLELVAATEAGGKTGVDLVAIFRLNRSPVLEAAFRRFLSTSDPNLSELGLQAMLAAGDASAIESVQQRYASLATRPTWLEIVQEIGQSYVTADPGAVRALCLLAVNPKTPQELRVATARALARVHTKQALPFLAQLLDSPDPSLRTFAVGGLSMFANNVPIGSHEPAAGEWPWRTDDTIAHSAMDGSNVAFWKSWWTANQTALTQ